MSIGVGTEDQADAVIAIRFAEPNAMTKLRRLVITTQAEPVQPPLEVGAATPTEPGPPLATPAERLKFEAFLDRVAGQADSLGLEANIVASLADGTAEIQISRVTRTEERP